MSRNIRLLYIHNFLTDFGLQTPYLVIYFSQMLGSYTAAMAVMAADQISSAVMDVPTGIMSDRIGRKTTLFIGSLASAGGVAFYAFSHGFAGFLTGAILSGLSRCLFNGNNNALLYETLQAEDKQNQYHHLLGRTGSMFQLALGISALCSSLFISHGLQLVFILGIIPQVLAAIVGLFFIEPRIHVHTEPHSWGHLTKAVKQTWRNQHLRRIVLGQAISYGAGEASFNFRNVFINQLWPLWALGIYRAVNNAGGFFGYWFSGPLIDRLKPGRVLMISQFYWAVTQGFAVWLANAFSPVIYMTGALFFGPSNVAIDKLLQDEFSDRERATMGSISSFASSVFYTIMAFIIGGVSDSLGIITGMAVGIAVSAGAIPVFWRVFRRYL